LTSSTIPWIEKLLQTPIHDCRKFSIWRVLSPYLINVRKLSFDDAYNLIKNWLNGCNNLRKLDFNPDYNIRYNLKMNLRNGYLPISANKLKTENRELYDLLRLHEG
jgi:hypothetical protein